MDPDKALKQLRKKVERFQQIEEGGLPAAEEHGGLTTLGSEIAQIFDGLDGWLSEGGFLPRDWKR